MSRAAKPLEQRMRETSTWRFTDAEQPGVHSVYRLIAKDGALLYIGCARDVEHRVYMHLQTYTMTDAWLIHQHYGSHTSEPYLSKSLARAAEIKAIATERPILNRQHNPTRWRRRDGVYVPADAETAAEMARLSRRPEPTPEGAAFMAELTAMFARTP